MHLCFGSFLFLGEHIERPRRPGWENQLDDGGELFGAESKAESRAEPQLTESSRASKGTLRLCFA